jgi:hypothetical protein
VVDSTYRWFVVLLLAAAYIFLLLPAFYRYRLPKRSVLWQMAAGTALVALGLILSQVFRESALDALLLRAIFGFMVPDTGIHGYGWFFVFGYAIFIANSVLLVVGIGVGLLRRRPPWSDPPEHR